MIDEKNRIIYYDNSTRSTFQACKEKARLGNRLGWRPKTTKQSLAFGHAFHAGWEAYYDALAGGWRDASGQWQTFGENPPSPLELAQVAFLKDMGHSGLDVMVSLESAERRSLERGLYLLEAYFYKYSKELYENIIVNERPLVEVPFRYFITSYDGYELWYVGIIDRVMRNILTKRPTIIEGKTTTQGLDIYVEQAKPNNQVTGYFPAAMLATGEEIKECVWDAVFISDRKPNLDKGLTNRWWAYGIDIDKDFKRHTTTRSVTDITRFKQDLEEDALEYAKWLLSSKTQWPQTTGACSSYGGCWFKNRCMLNLEPEQEESYMQTFFVQQRWEPWKKLQS